MIFGGFHDNLRDSKYFNDVHAFDLEDRQWKKLEVVGKAPEARSASNCFALADGRIVVYGGFAKVKVSAFKFPKIFQIKIFKNPFFKFLININLNRKSFTEQEKKFHGDLQQFKWYP